MKGSWIFSFFSTSKRSYLIDSWCRLPSFFSECVSFWWSLIFFFHSILISFIFFVGFENFLCLKALLGPIGHSFVDNHLSWSCFQISLFTNRYFVVCNRCIHKFSYFGFTHPFNIQRVLLFAFSPNPNISPRWSLKLFTKRGRLTHKSWINLITKEHIILTFKKLTFSKASLSL